MKKNVFKKCVLGIVVMLMLVTSIFVFSKFVVDENVVKANEIFSPLGYETETGYNANWSYYKQITVTNNKDNYQTRIVVGNSSGGDVTLEGHLGMPDFTDLRFCGTDNVTELNYWIENKSDDNWAVVWLNNSENYSTIRMFYGNDKSPDGVSNATNTWDFWLNWTTDKTSLFTKYEEATSRYYTYSTPTSSFSFSNGIRILEKTCVVSTVSTSSPTASYFCALDAADDFFDSNNNVRRRFRVDSDSSPDFDICLTVEDDNAPISGINSLYTYTANQYDVGEFVGVSTAYANFSLYENNSNGSLLAYSTVTSGVPIDTLAYMGYGGDSYVASAPDNNYWSYDSVNQSIQWGVAESGRSTEVLKNKWFCIGKYCVVEPSLGFGSEQTNAAAQSSFSLKGLQNNRITWSGVAGTTVYCNSSGDFNEWLEINMSINVTDNITEIRVNVSDLNDTNAWVNASNITLFVSSDNVSYGVLGTFVDGGSNISINSTNWNAGTMGTNPFSSQGLSNRTISVWCIFRLKIPSGLSTDVFYSLSATAWKIYLGHYI